MCLSLAVAVVAAETFVPAVVAAVSTTKSVII
jgi:hypothetical protein